MVSSLSGLTSQRTTLRLKTILKKYPFIMVVFIFGFLLIRNWDVFANTDVYDGAKVKLDIAANGVSFDSFKTYVHDYVLKAYSQHFLPVWFLIFYGITVLFDSNPIVLGSLSFMAAAGILYALYRILRHFNTGQRQNLSYSLFAILLFSSSIYFLEMIAWKWMLCLLLSTLCLLFGLVIALEKKLRDKWLVVYGLLLLCAIWTFGTSWVGVLGLAIFLWLKKANKQTIGVTLAIAVVGMIGSWWFNRGAVPPLNIPFILVNLPGLLVVITANAILQTIGVLRFIAFDNMRMSSVLGAAILALFAGWAVTKFRSKKLSEKDALIIGLVSTYVATITLSLMRLSPTQGLTPTAGFESYVFGGRYLFVFAIPLFLVISLHFVKSFKALSNFTVYCLIAAALLLGIVVRTVYPKLDPVITNKNRTQFYNMTSRATEQAVDEKLVLPNTASDLLFKSQPVSLERAIGIRLSASKMGLQFKSPEFLSSNECVAIHNNATVTDWLNSYSTDWCKAI